MLLAARRGATVAGIDATRELIDIARERVPGAELVVGYDEALPFEPESFDVVTAFNSAEYAADPVSLLKQMAHTAKTGGLVAVLGVGSTRELRERRDVRRDGTAHAARTARRGLAPSRGVNRANSSSLRAWRD